MGSNVARRGKWKKKNELVLLSLLPLLLLLLSLLPLLLLLPHNFCIVAYGPSFSREMGHKNNESISLWFFFF